ncbi:DUF3888 domain-containing protein [Alkalihalobacillus sp. MEB130]|uniref:DUF3888 domain-containing protein n=1 Tax=Alkalihalobacillus sp. MEB130 TaxID=2976704 RepID=UPI0028DED0D5|nr:DUF3888 domain-containing protein [Alkalihalobacillus sp. MEB130]MDT8861283.1 DUF3888 domain-containing protein [Alkalihalobacillus sp. MEB130]
MKQSIFAIVISFFAVFSWNTFSVAQLTDSLPTEDTKELMVQDMLMLLLGEEIDKAVSNFYNEYVTESPLVYPYQIDIVDVKRVHGFRSFHFYITLEATPVVGPHISVGKDRLTFEIAPTLSGQVKLRKYEHLETHELPPNWKHIMKQNA